MKNIVQRIIEFISVVLLLFVVAFLVIIMATVAGIMLLIFLIKWFFGIPTKLEITRTEDGREIRETQVYRWTKRIK